MSRNNEHRPMSIDAALDMERQEVLALLENRPQNPASPERMRASSPYAPRSPVRSMLDIDEEPVSSAPPSPVATKTTPVAQAPVRSMLTFNTPVPDRSKSRGSSPVSAVPPSTTTRSKSDASAYPVDFGPRASMSGAGNDPTSGYQFDILPAPVAGQMPKRNSQGPWKGSAMGEALRNPGGIQLPGDRGRNRSVGSRLSGKSTSPHERLANRSRSPVPYSPQLPTGKAYLGDGQVLELNNAYRRLSAANIAMSGGSLAQLPPGKLAEEQSGRLAKSYIGPDGEQLDSSEDEEEDYSTDDEERGRNKVPRSLHPGSTDGKPKSKSRSRSTKRETKSLLAAAEEERELHIACPW